MFQARLLTAEDKPALYADLAGQLAGLLGDERDVIANAANTAALIFTSLPDLNWAGFYFLRDGELVVGPFQGKPACVRIALGKRRLRHGSGRATDDRRRRCRTRFPATSPATPPRGRRSSCRCSRRPA